MRGVFLIFTIFIFAVFIGFAVRLFFFKHHDQSGGVKTVVQTQAPHSVTGAGGQEYQPAAPQQQRRRLFLNVIEDGGAQSHLPGIKEESVSASPKPSAVPVPKHTAADRTGIPTNQTIGADVPQKSKPPLEKPVLTEEEVFNTLYPPFYMDFLANIEKEMVAQGWLESEAVTPMSSEPEMKAFFLNVGAVLFEKGTITNDQLESLKNGVSFVFDAPYSRKLHEATELFEANKTFSTTTIITSSRDRRDFLEKTKIHEIAGTTTIFSLPAFKEFEKEFSSQEASSTKTGAAAVGRVLTGPLLKIVQLLASVFPDALSTPEADAFCGPTYCISPPVCFLPGAPAPAGFNFLAPCCFGRICGIPIGCFELCGNGARPFIYDPMLSICGCG